MLFSDVRVISKSEILSKTKESRGTFLFHSKKGMEILIVLFFSNSILVYV